VVAEAVVALEALAVAALVAAVLAVAGKTNSIICIMAKHLHFTIFILLVSLNCFGQNKRVVTVHLHFYYGDNSPLGKTCACALPGERPALDCAGIDSVEICVYKGTTLIKKIHTDDTGACPNLRLNAGIYNLTCIKKKMDTLQATITIPGEPNSYCKISVMGTEDYISVLSRDTTINDDEYCCLLMPVAEKKKNGVRIVPKY
jgi:hypothetical protein